MLKNNLPAIFNVVMSFRKVRCLNEAELSSKRSKQITDGRDQLWRRVWDRYTHTQNCFLYVLCLYRAHLESIVMPFAHLWALSFYNAWHHASYMAEQITDHLNTNNIPLMDWPPNNPGLNRTDHLWDHLIK